MADKKISIKKILNVILTVIVCFFLLIGIFAVILTITSKKSSDGTSQIFGYQMRVVLSPSMEKCEFTDVSDFEIKDIPVGSMVFVKAVPEDDSKLDEWFSQLKVGDVLTFRYRYQTQETITHRIKSIEKNDHNGYDIVLVGDNKNAEDGALEQFIDTSEHNTSPNYVLGKVVGQSKAIGWIVNLLTEHKLALLFVLIVPCAIIIVFEIMKIFDAVNAEKKAKKKIEEEAKQNELEELKKQIAALQQQAVNVKADPSDSREQNQSPEPTADASQGDSGENGQL